MSRVNKEYMPACKKITIVKVLHENDLWSRPPDLLSEQKKNVSFNLPFECYYNNHVLSKIGLGLDK